MELTPCQQILIEKAPINLLELLPIVSTKYTAVAHEVINPIPTMNRRVFSQSLCPNSFIEKYQLNSFE